MSIKKVRRGDALLPHLTAEWYNSTVDGGGEAPPSALTGQWESNGCRIKIQNNTGSNLNRYSIVGLGGAVFNASYSGQSLTSFLNGLPLIQGATPDSTTHAFRFAVLLESVLDGRNAEALVIGVCPVPVYVSDTNHTYADVVTGETSYLTSGTSGGAKLLTTPTQTGLQWCLVRVGIQPVSVTQNYVEYTLDNRLVGFNAARGSSLVLDASNLTGWTGSVYRAGSESNVGIEYQTSETAPNTNGLWKATQDGLFRITINGYWKLVGITEPSKQNQDVVTTGPASAGTAHTHSVTQTGHDNYILSVGPKLQIDLYNKKASGGAIAFHSDANGRFFQWQQWLPVTISSRFIPVVAQWNVCLAQNDKVALKWTAASMINHEWSRDGDPLKVRFEYIGEAQDWAAI